MRRKSWKRGIGAFLAAGLCLLLIFPAAASKSGLNSAKEKKTALEQEKKKTENALRELESLKSNTQAYVKQLDANLAGLDDELEALESDISDKEAEISQAAEDLSAAKETEKEQYESMKLRIKYMYEKGDSSYVDLLMESGSLSELLNKAEYIGKISSYDRKKLDEYIAIGEEIARQEEKLQNERENLLDLQQETEARQASVAQLLSAKQTELANYQSKIGAVQGQLSEYEKDIKAQEDSIAAIEAAIKRQEEEAKKKAAQAGTSYKTVSLGDITFTWPCPSSSRITSGFGGRSSPTEGASSNHKGIDIGASTGANIVAAADGQVAVATYSTSAGNYVMLNHGGGVSTVYMHASKLLVSSGQSVKKGQVIAKVGSTGYSTGSHLHFGVRVNGTYVNPRKYVSP